MTSEIIKTIGRRKTAIARVKVVPGKGEMTVNKRDFKEYFPVPTLQIIVKQPFEALDPSKLYDVTANVMGGGISGQAVAVRLAISRALCKIDSTNRPILKKAGFLTRDPRMVERKKFGRVKARKRFQFSKR